MCVLPCLKPYNQHKLNFHNTKYVFLGFSKAHKGFRCLLSTAKIYTSRYVVFHESDFPFKEGFLKTNQPARVSEVPYNLLPLFLDREEQFNFNDKSDSQLLSNSQKCPLRIDLQKIISLVHVKKK